MRNKPIADPEFIGCGFCGTVPPTVLSDDKSFFPSSVSILEITIDDFTYQWEWLDLKYYDSEIPDTAVVTLKSINEQFADRLKSCTYAELTETTPLHDETYELNKDDGKWYLIKQGLGYA